MEDIVNPRLYEYDITENTLHEIKIPNDILVCNP